MKDDRNRNVGSTEQEGHRSPYLNGRVTWQVVIEMKSPLISQPGRETETWCPKFTRLRCGNAR